MGTLKKQAKAMRELHRKSSLKLRGQVERLGGFRESWRKEFPWFLTVF